MTWWYYVIYTSEGTTSACVLPQIPPENADDGMNIGVAYALLYQLVGHPLIILSWRRITQNRKEGFQKFVNEVLGAPPPANTNSVRHLHLVRKTDEPPKSPA